MKNLRMDGKAKKIDQLRKINYEKVEIFEKTKDRQIYKYT
jgi:hypothetical protein